MLTAIEALVLRDPAAGSAATSDALNGTWLTWTHWEQRRSDILWGIGKRHCANSGDLLDPENRDPNYLTEAEWASSSWVVS